VNIYSRPTIDRLVAKKQCQTSLWRSSTYKCYKCQNCRC